MNPSTDPYEVLGVDSCSTGRKIKERYRILSKRYPPDLNPGNSEAEEKFKLVQWAYDHITGRGKRPRCGKGTSNPQPQAGDPEHPFMSFFEALKSYCSKRGRGTLEGQG